MSVTNTYSLNVIGTSVAVREGEGEREGERGREGREGKAETRVNAALL